MEKDYQQSFFIEKSSVIEELLSKYSNFKKDYILNQAKEVELRTTLDKDFISKMWIHEKHVVVHDLVFNDIRIAVDTIINLDKVVITIFGRDNKSSEYIRNNDFYIKTGINSDLIPKPNKRLIYKEFIKNDKLEKDEISLEDISDSLIGLLGLLEKLK